MAIIDQNFDWVDTPNPTERCFSITAKEDAGVEIPDFINHVVLWSDCPAWIKLAEVVPAALQGYTLVHAVKAGYQLRTFIFGRTRSLEERSAPYLVEWVKRPYAWPTVLQKLWFEEGNLALNAADGEGGKRVHARSKSRRGAIYPTWHKISHFLSERPFAKTRSPVPITDSISYSFDGVSGSFPECLHPGCRFPQYQTSGKVVFGAGTPSVEIGGDIVAQEFPATNMTDWEKHATEDNRYQVSGMYYRQLVEAYPPLDDREILG
ncbi:MAG: hypothetical protein B7Z37_30580 [Verrucomicrobia bacterium 12-59-8]|nr:MAG: hypothetical protein B7Z37_30580 [Verrucomicrobia bacterium 12-59-8]